MKNVPAFFAKSDSLAWFIAFLTVFITIPAALFACRVTLNVSDSIVFNFCLEII